MKIKYLLLFIGLLLQKTVDCQRLQPLNYGYINTWSPIDITPKEISKIVREKSKLKDYNEQLTIQNGRLRDRFSTLSNESRKLKAKANRTASENKRLSELNASYLQLIDELQSDLVSVKELYKKAKNRSEKYKSEIERLENELESTLQLLQEISAELEDYKEFASELELELLFSKSELNEVKKQMSIYGTDILVSGKRVYSALRNKEIKRNASITVETTYYIQSDKFDGDFNTTVPAIFYLSKPDGTELKQEFPLKIINVIEPVERFDFRAKKVKFTPIRKGVILRGRKKIDLSKSITKKDFKRKSKSQNFYFRLIINQDIILYGKINLKKSKCKIF